MSVMEISQEQILDMIRQEEGMLGKAVEIKEILLTQDEGIKVFYESEEVAK